MSGARQEGVARSPRHRARELALQGIYEWRLSGRSAAQIEQSTRAEKSLGRYDPVLFGELLRGAIAEHETLAALLIPHLDRSLDEVSPVEYAVLLIGAYELTRHPEIPYRAVINEAVELAKTFGSSEGYKFVNGVMDKLAAAVRPDEVVAR